MYYIEVLAIIDPVWSLFTSPRQKNYLNMMIKKIGYHNVFAEIKSFNITIFYFLRSVSNFILG